MMPERASRTFICSVLFLDIVGYSRKPVAEQIRLKDRFNGLIASAIREISPADRIILDTGDGVAISFLGDPEDALFVAMSLRDAFAPNPDEAPEVPARIGLNLGPVRLVRDLNGRPNIIGDGINVAQRVMAFADAGQILVSRSYFEIVSHISEDYIKLFTYQGSRTDKHVREHEIYSVGYSTPETALKSPAERARRSTGEALSRNTAGNATTARLIFHVEKWLGYRPLAYATATFSALVFLLALVTSIVGEAPQASQSQQTAAVKNQLKAAKSPVAATRNVATDEPALANAEPANSKQSASKQSTATASNSAPPTSGDAEPAAADESAPKPKRRFLHLPFFGSSDDSESKQAAATPPADDQSGAADTAPVNTASGAAAAAGDAGDGAAMDSATSLANLDEGSTDNARVQRSATGGGHATIALAISPWGEVFVDGKPIGVSPPLNEIELLPGSRLIEIRNGDFPPFSQRVDLKAQQRIKIRYKFN